MSTVNQALRHYREGGVSEVARRAVDYYSRQFLWKAHEVRYRINGGDPEIPVTTPLGSITMFVDREWPLLGKTASGEPYEPNLMAELKSTLDSDMTFYNIGARWGIFSLFATKAGVTPSNIHNFEAGAKEYYLLERNHSGMNTNLVHRYVDSSDGIDRITLDTYTDERATPDVIKIDVEGAEYKVLEGANNVLDSSHPKLYVEVHPEYIKEGSVEDLFQLLERNGYELFVMADHRGDEGRWTSLENADLKETGDYMIRGV